MELLLMVSLLTCRSAAEYFLGQVGALLLREYNSWGVARGNSSDTFIVQSFTIARMMLIAPRLTGWFGYCKRNAIWVIIAASMVQAKAQRNGCTDHKRLRTGRDSVENQLHWVLDILFCEDESRARADNSAKKRKVLRHWAYDLPKAHACVCGNPSDNQFKCLLDEAFLEQILASACCS